MEFEAIVNSVLPVVKGTSARGEWVKQDVIFDMPGEFNRKACISFWGDKAADAANYKPGMALVLSVNIESREYNGRWFTEVRAWKAVPKVVEAQPMAAAGGFPPIVAEESAYANDSIDDIPF